jgi:hypothetical protein
MSDRPSAVEALRTEVGLLAASEGTQVTVPLWACVEAIRQLDAIVMTEAEQRAMSASVELTAAMRDLVGDEWTAEHDLAEIVSRIHDLQARIVLSAASRLGWTRPLGG